LAEQSRTLLEDIMDTSSRPEALALKQSASDQPPIELLADYLKRVNLGDIESTEVLAIRGKLDKFFGQNNGQLRLADMAINRWKAINKTKETRSNS
jgi:hypothetical protein